METKARQRVAHTESVRDKHKAKAEKQTLIPRNCLMQFALNIHPLMVVPSMSRWILASLGSHNLKCLKEACRFLLVHIDATCKAVTHNEYVHCANTKKYKWRALCFLHVKSK